MIDHFTDEEPEVQRGSMTSRSHATVEEEGFPPRVLKPMVLPALQQSLSGTGDSG